MNHHQDIKITAPKWLADTPEIERLLHWFTDRLDHKSFVDRSRPLSQRLNEKQLPYFFDKRFGNDIDELWQLLEALAEDGILDLDKHGHPDYVNCTIRLRPEAESVVRQWISRVDQRPARVAWESEVRKALPFFRGSVARLIAHPIEVPGRSVNEIIEAFVNLGKSTFTDHTLRQLSARHFWGDSKFLEQRENLIDELYPGILISVKPRPIHLCVHLPANPRGFLIIENQDCFDYCSTLNPVKTDHMVLVYGQGFKTTAERLRDVKGVRFLLTTGTSRSNSLNFLQHNWFSPDADIPVWFWGDLDFSALQMVKSLRLRFPALQCWKPGYEPMLARINEGHLPVGFHQKGMQTDPGLTGCDYADQRLRPALQATGRFIDQEWVTL